MNIPDYSQYAFEDFVLDADFRAWVNSPDRENHDFWEELIEVHPEKEEIIMKAIFTVQNLSFSFDEINVDKKNEIWKTLESNFDLSNYKTKAPVLRKLKIYWVAASITISLLAISAFIFYLSAPHLQKIETAYGEVKKIKLPDGSEVMLNGNSSIKYLSKWEEGNDREVWVEGEAFFKVSKIKRNSIRVKFITHTPQLDILVLGTKYNVNARRGKTKVMLVEGKIQLKSFSSKHAQTMEMKPGEFATSLASIEKADIYRAKPELYDAWTRRQFMFENAPLTEVAATIEDTYGLKLIFEDSEMADYRFTANFQNENVETLITVIEATFDLKTEHRGNKFYLNRK